MDPVSTAPRALVPACPGQGDSVDGLADDYFGPGFSFSSGWGAERWLKARTVVLSLARLRGAGRVRIPVSLAASGTPPRGCATVYLWQRCLMGGTWAGMVTLTRR